MFLAIALLTILQGPLARADEPKQLDNASAEALGKTQDLLLDRQAREDAVKKDPNAQRADQNARSLAGSQENLDAIYGLSADVMETLTKDANGDPEKMMKTLAAAMANPEAFAAKLTPEQKAKLEAIAQKTPAAAAQKTQP